MEIKKEITINASATRVFRAITDPKQITKWFPDIESIDPKIGGKVSFKFLDFDTNNQNNKDRILEGKITELEENRKLVYTWGHSNTPESPITQVTWILEEIETRKTRVTITHTGFLDEISMKPYNEQWDWLAERLNAFAESKKRINCSWKQLFAFFSSFFANIPVEKIKPAKGRVNVKWQIVFAYIPGVLIWSFYRIKKLRLFLIMMVIPLLASMYLIPLAIVGTEYFEYCNPVLLLIWPNDLSCYNEAILVPSIIVELIYHGFRTYFIIKWSRQWNESAIQGVKNLK